VETCGTRKGDVRAGTGKHYGNASEYCIREESHQPKKKKPPKPKHPPQKKEKKAQSHPTQKTPHKTHPKKKKHHTQQKPTHSGDGGSRNHADKKRTALRITRKSYWGDYGMGRSALIIRAGINFSS